MPLYHIKSIVIDDVNLMDEARLRRMWTLVIRHSNEYLMENNKYPIIFVNYIAFEILEKSFLFHKNIVSDVEYLGNFQNFNVFLSEELIDDEYFIGLIEELKINRRKNKLNKICGVIMEEKQR